MRKLALLLALVLASGAALAQSADVKGAMDRLIKQTGVYATNPPRARPPALSPIPVGRSRCRITGCWARWPVSMSTATTISGFPTAPAP